MCRVLEASKTGYYKFRRNLGKPGKDAILSAGIKEILDESVFNDNYGVQRMQTALSNNGITAGILKITRVMRENGWFHERKHRPLGLMKATMKYSKRRI